MPSQNAFTQCTPLPAGVSRATAMAALRDHRSMIDLNPLVQERVLCRPPGKSPPEEYSGIWYAITDKVSYLPGVKGRVTYHACFHDLPDGLQTHVYAPLGVDIRERWSVGGNEPGETQQPPPMGIGAPKHGLYLREDIDLRCNFTLSNFVKKNLKSAHGTLVSRLVYLAAEYEGKLEKEGSGGAGQVPISPTTADPRTSFSNYSLGERATFKPSPIAHHTTYQDSVNSPSRFSADMTAYEPQLPNHSNFHTTSDTSAGPNNGSKRTPESGYASLQDPSGGPWAPLDHAADVQDMRNQPQAYTGQPTPWGPQSYHGPRYTNSSMPGELDAGSPQQAHQVMPVQQAGPPLPPKLPARNSLRPTYNGAAELE